MSNNNYSSSREENFKNARNDYGNGHRFNSRGLAPAFLGADSIPQAVSDTHWSMHGLAKRIDEVEGEIVTIDNTQKDTVYSSEEIFDKVGELIVGGSQSLSNYTGYFTKVLTTRPRIFSDSFTCESYMAANDRLRGFTSDYQWISYNADSINCEGALDKIIDYTYCTDHHDKDNKNAKFIFKGRITLPQLGTLKRVFVTQKDNNLIIRYLLTNTISDGGIIGYTGTIVREEYDYTGTRVRKSHESIAHTPLMLLGAFSIDPNDNKDYIQYISTDYKLIQHFDDEDLILGQLPTDVIDMIDPVNDLVSDSKVAYIMTYDDKGHLKFPLKGFTLTNSLQQSTYKAEDTTTDDTTEDTIPPFEDGEEYLKVSDMFTITILENSNSSTIMDKIISITPRVDSHRLTKGNPDGQVWSEGGFYAEVYDNEEPDTNHYYTAASHIFYMADRLSWPDADWFANTMFDYYTDKPSDYSFYRERDYLEFPNITFYNGMEKIFPEISSDFNIIDKSFKIDFDHSIISEKLTINLEEPFILTRDLVSMSVNNRHGYTVLQNSDYVIDKANMNILAVYSKLDFVLNSDDEIHNYETLQPNFNADGHAPDYVRYQLINQLLDENTASDRKCITRLTFFSSRLTYSLDFDSLTGELITNSNFDHQFSDYAGQIVSSRGAKNAYLYNLTNSHIMFTTSDAYKDLPFMYTHKDAYGKDLNHSFLLVNKQDSTGFTQELFSTEIGASSTVGLKFVRNIIVNDGVVSSVSTWSCQGEVQWVNTSSLPGRKDLLDRGITKDVFQLLGTTGNYNLIEKVTPATAFPNTSPSTGTTNIGEWIGKYVGTAQPLHAVFANARNVSIEVYDEKEKYRHVKITVTDSLGKSMSYHNATLSTGKTASGATLDSLVPSTSGGYDFVLYPWLPGDYVGDDDNPKPPDLKAFYKEILRRIADLYARDIEVKKTDSILMHKEGDWQDKNNVGTWDPVEGEWTFPENEELLSADVILSETNDAYAYSGKSYSLPNSTVIKDDGLYTPSYLEVINHLSDRNVTFTDTKSNTYEVNGEWSSGDKVIDVKTNVHYSNLTVTKSIPNIGTKTVGNAASTDTSGVFVPDISEFVNQVQSNLNVETNSRTDADLELQNQVDQLMARNVTFTDTKSNTYEVTGSWSSDNKVINVKTNVHYSNLTVAKSITDIGTKTVGNAASTDASGVFVPDTSEFIRQVQLNLNTETSSRIDADQVLQNQINTITSFLSLLVTNMNSSGAYTGTYQSGSFNGNLAYGNINVYGGAQDGANYIKTSPTSPNLSIATGL